MWYTPAGMVQGVFFGLFGGLFRLVNRWGNPLQCAFAYACMHRGGHNVLGPMDAVAEAQFSGHLGPFCEGHTPRVCVADLVRATHLVVVWCVLCGLRSAGYTPGCGVVPTLPRLHTCGCGVVPTLP